jgi:hypothetical protein
MMMIVINLVRRTLPQKSNEMFYITAVGFGPDIVWILGGRGLEWYEKQQFLFGKKFDHFTKLERITGSTTIIAQSTLTSTRRIEVDEMHLERCNCPENAGPTIGKLSYSLLVIYPYGR